jgi:hypothetical protein
MGQHIYIYKGRNFRRMTEITFLASSKPIEIPNEIEEYNNRTVFEREEDVIFFSVQDYSTNGAV